MKFIYFLIPLVAKVNAFLKHYLRHYLQTAKVSIILNRLRNY